MTKIKKCKFVDTNLIIISTLIKLNNYKWKWLKVKYK